MTKIKKSKELELLEEIKKSIDELKAQQVYPYYPYYPDRYRPYTHPTVIWYWNETSTYDPCVLNGDTGTAYNDDGDIIAYRYS